MWALLLSPATPAYSKVVRGFAWLPLTTRGELSSAGGFPFFLPTEKYKFD
jgi:hypothetical protein